MTRTLRFLQAVHLIVFIAAVAVVSALHIYTQDFLDFLRFPILLKSINPFLGSGWPASLHVYQTILIIYLAIVLLDGLGLFFYKSKVWRGISDLTSFLGFLLIWPIILFLVLTLASSETLTTQNVKTILSYFAFSLFLFLLDLVTWYFDERSLIKLKRS